jgi:hypothetical protein
MSGIKQFTPLIQYTLYVPRKPKYKSRGIESTTGPDGKMIVLRVLKDELDVVDQAADLYGLSRNVFVRSVVVDAASFLLNDYKSQTETG